MNQFNAVGEILIRTKCPIVLTKDQEWANRFVHSNSQFKAGQIIVLPKDAILVDPPEPNI